MSEHENFTYIPDYNSLSLTGRVLGTRTGSNSALCCHKNINKRSRRKPYGSLGSWGVQLYGASGGDESAIVAANFEMTPAVIVKPADGSDDVTGCVGRWGQWERPKPDDENSYKRMDDFCRYWKNAVNHIKEFIYSSGSRPKLMNNTPFSVVVKFNGDHDRIVTLDDMNYNGAEIGSMYLTVAIASCNANGNLYGAQWAVMQSAVTLATAVRPAVAGAAMQLEIEFDNFKDLVDDVTTNFGKYFMAVGFAPKCETGTAKAIKKGTMKYVKNPAGVRTMPLPYIINPDMYDEGWAVASIGGLTASLQYQEKYFDVVCSISKSANFGVSVGSETKNGKKGFGVYVGGQLSCYLSGVEAARKNDGFIVWLFSVSAESTYGESVYKEYFVMMQQGCSSNKYITLTDSVVTTATPGLAVNGTGWVNEAKAWFKETYPEFGIEELTDGMFVEMNGALKSMEVAVEILGAPSNEGAAVELYVPRPKRSASGTDYGVTLELYHY